MLEQRRDWPEVRRQRVEVAAGEKVVLTLIALSAESAGGAATLMAVPVSTVSATAFYGFPDAVTHLRRILHPINGPGSISQPPIVITDVEKPGCERRGDEEEDPER